MRTTPRKRTLAMVLAASSLGLGPVAGLAAAPAGADPLAGAASAAPAAAGDGSSSLGGSRTRAPKAVGAIDKTVRKGTPAQVALAHLAAHADTYKVDAAALKEVRTTSKNGQQSVRLQQLHAGVPVFGAQYVVHTADTSGGRVVESTTGTVFTDLTASTKPVVSEALAEQRLHLDRKVAGVVDPVVESQGLVVLPVGTGALAWQFVVSGVGAAGEPIRQQVFIDARVGGIALSYNLIHAAEAAEGTGVRDSGAEVRLAVTQTDTGTFELRDRSRAMFAESEGEILTFDAEGRDYSQYAGALPADTPVVSSGTSHFSGVATTSGAVDAHLNSGKVYEYLRSVLGRDGLDGAGGSMKSVVNVTANGAPYGNAFWDGTKMVYGTYEEGVPFSAALDVVAHEMSHGVTEHGANLAYINQSGAINEALSDYFGNALETDDLGIAMDDPTSGLVGENLCRDGDPAECALRDLNDGRRADSDYVLLAVDYDNGGVHLNSTIAGGALWDIRQGIDPHLADRIVHAAQTEYLTPLSTFTDLRHAIEFAAQREHATAADRAVIAKAFDDHGIVDGWEEKAYSSDATTLATDIVSGYEGWGPADDTAAVMSGDRWAASTLGIVEFFAGTHEFSIITGEFSKPDKTRRINNQGAWDLNPTMSGDRLAWTRITPEGVDVVGQIGDGLASTTVLAGGPGDQIRPSLDGTTLAWLNVADGETDVWVRRGDAAPVNLTPEAGTAATEVTVRDDLLVWSSADYVNTVDLDTSAAARVRVGGWVFSDVTDVQVTEDGVWYRSGGFFGDAIHWSPLENVAATKRLNLGRALYAFQFTVNDDYLAFDTTTFWGALSYPTNAETHKLRIAPVADVLAGTSSWQRVSCASGAQISPQLGDGTRLVWLDTSHARTDLVTRDDVAGTC